MGADSNKESIGVSRLWGFSQLHIQEDDTTAVVKGRSHWVKVGVICSCYSLRVCLDGGILNSEKF